MPFNPTRPIVCAAIRNEAGQIICSARHFDPLMRQQINATISGPEHWKIAEQGFINTHGEFLTREEAHHVALAHGQRKRRCGGDADRLFSENLY